MATSNREKPKEEEEVVANPAVPRLHASLCLSTAASWILAKYTGKKWTFTLSEKYSFRFDEIIFKKEVTLICLVLIRKK